MSPAADPNPTRDLFGQPLPSPAELVPVRTGPLSPTPPVASADMPTEDRSQSAAGPVTDSPPSSGEADPAAERDRLLSLCRSLRAVHRCPGRCVLSGELGQGGLPTFRRLTEDTE